MRWSSRVWYFGRASANSILGFVLTNPSNSASGDELEARLTEPELTVNECVSSSLITDALLLACSSSSFLAGGVVRMPSKVFSLLACFALCSNPADFIKLPFGPGTRFVCLYLGTRLAFNGLSTSFAN